MKMTNQKLCLIILAVSNIVTLLLLSIFIFRYDIIPKIYEKCREFVHINAHPPNYKRNQRYHVQKSLYDMYETRKFNIVMLGDSIIHVVNWNELLLRTDIANRGIGGDTTAGFLHRLEYVYNLQPEICFIMGGINDIFKGIPSEAVFRNYKNIVENLKKRDIIPVIQSTLYVSSLVGRHRCKNAEVDQLNKMLKKFSETNGIDYINLNALFSEGDSLNEEFTYDGCHLWGQAYALWRIKVIEVLNKYNL